MTPELPFGPATRAWFSGAFDAPTAAQRAAWPAIVAGEHALLVAPTGSGKTLSAFLAALDRLFHLPTDAAPGVRVLYVSPLKALAVDVERNLRAPLVGIRQQAAALGQPLRDVRVDVRTGDSPAAQRRAFLRSPGDVLVTTPESLYLLLTSRAAEALRSVEVVIVDEVHALLGTRRGVHLALSLERLVALTERDPQRIGLSATVRPVATAATWLGGVRPVRVLDASARPDLDLRVVVPVEDMERPPVPEATRVDAYAAVAPADHGYPTNQPRGGMWPAIHPVLLDAIRAHRSTLVFCNSRLLCERTCRSLNELAGADLVRAHHGSVSHEQRREIEEALKRGDLPALVATSSLELGIDMGAIDLVVLLASPGSVSAGLQRVGRSGHHVGGRSAGRIFPRHRGDLVECAVVAQRMLDAAIETTRLPGPCLDVLAQQVVAIVAAGPRPAEEVLALVRRAASYRDLSREVFDRVLELASGRWSGDVLAEVAPTLVWDRTDDVLRPRRNTRLTAVLNGGTIPDRGLYRVRLGAGGPRIGELDEEMVYESRAGDHVILGASTWRIDAIERDEVVVSPAPGRPGRLPFWKGEAVGRPVELGRAVGAFLRRVEAADDPVAAVLAEAPLDERAARNLVSYVQEQREATGAVPTDQVLVIERFRDELGDWRVCLLTPLGHRVHAPWALAIEALLTRRTGVVVQTMASDDGITLRLADGGTPPDLDVLLPDPEEVEELVLEAVRGTSLFAGRFREAAARALLTPRRSAKGRRPLWLQRRRAEALLASVGALPSFPIVLEVYREILQDVFDLPSLIDLLGRLRRREHRRVEVETRRPSPFARSLVFQFVGTWMYEGDAPLAERRAMALALDRGLLAELLGQESLRELLDPDAIAEVEAELQAIAPGWKAEHPDGLADLLRRLGALDGASIAPRCADDPAPWIEALLADRRAVWLRVAGRPRLVDVDDAAVWRDALGVVLPAWLPSAALDPIPDAVDALVRRWVRCHGPFTSATVAAELGLPRGQVEVVLRGLAATGAVVYGALSAGADAWCDAEVLRRIKRRTLARLRREAEPVSQSEWASFLPGWHGMDRLRDGPGALHDAVSRLEGCALPWSEVEASILPARVERYQPAALDQLGAAGEIAWVGRGGLSARDGLVALVPRDTLAELAPSTAPPEGPLHRAVLEHLQRRGACFLAELLRLGEPVAVASALAELAWSGHVTNDTFAPLRGFASGASPSSLAGGRWSRVDDGAVEPARGALEARRVRALTALLQRYGVVARDHVQAEGLEGGWTAAVAVLSALEAAGRVQRGWFVEGLGSAQFALPGAVERMRASRGQPAQLRWLAASDPAQPWGHVLPWPATLRPEARPRRIPGARVATWGGAPVVWLGPGGHLIRFIDGAAQLAAAVDALRAGLGWRTLRIERIDGEPALRVASAPELAALGLPRDLKGLLIERRSG